MHSRRTPFRSTRLDAAARRIICAGLCLAALYLLSACSAWNQTGLPTPIPAEFMPTVIQKTLQAQGVALSSPAPAGQALAGAAQLAALTQTAARPNLTQTLRTVMPSATPSVTPTATLAPPTATRPSPTPTIPPATPTPTLPPPFPDAPIQIYQLGELSPVISPIRVSMRLSSQVGKNMRAELYGEDGRLLARYLRTFHRIPWETARVDVDLEFEIGGAGEIGRVVVSVEDVFGRIMDVNSVNLLLLSHGATQPNPATALWQRLIIEEPSPLEMVQGGVLIISGRALPNNPDQPLRVMLVGEDGRVLGQRLARVDVATPGDYGVYISEVPYTVTALTPARLVIYEEGEPISDIAHLSSIEVLLAP